MKLSKEERDELIYKTKFVEEIAKVVYSFDKSIIGYRYEIYGTEEDPAQLEVLVIEYKGGAIAVRNCTADSLNCILKEMAFLMCGGHYQNLLRYEAIKEFRTPLDLSKEWQ